MKINFIPKGSEVFDNKKLIAKTTRRFDLGDIPQGCDYEPKLETGAKYDVFIFKFEGQIIYEHPNFIEFSKPLNL